MLLSEISFEKLDLKDPIGTIGVLLDASYVHPGRSARHHLEWLALSNHLDRQRVDEVLALVGLTEATIFHDIIYAIVGIAGDNFCSLLRHLVIYHMRLML